MRALNFITTDQGLEMRDQEGKRLDQHFVPVDKSDFVSKALYMAFNRYGRNASELIQDEDLLKAFNERYWFIHGEDATDYLRHLKSYSPDTDWNGALATNGGWYYFKKLDKAGFGHGFAAQMAFNRAMLDIIPEKTEMMKLLNLKEV